ncbi:hypothetical protein [Paenibacillus sp. BJ-4]|uniref:hypothetical protein n=1 Tax=Paenibacillus sp. BJ-4 TaxID=2878097 RepID=UPI001CF061A1|nr:hypothetical protein [Paenibacillus sp. BJ-4]
MRAKKYIIWMTAVISLTAMLAACGDPKQKVKEKLRPERLLLRLQLPQLHRPLRWILMLRDRQV